MATNRYLVNHSAVNTVGYVQNTSSTSAGWNTLGTQIDSDDIESYGTTLKSFLDSASKPAEISKEALEELLDKDEDMVPIVKGYLYKYLEDAMENHEEIIEKVLKYKDKEVKELQETNEFLKEKLDNVIGRLYILEQRIATLELGNTTIGGGYNNGQWPLGTTICSGKIDHLSTTATSASAIANAANQVTTAIC